VGDIARAERGAWPLGVPDVYAIDDAHIAAYARAARTREGFEQYLREFVWQSRKSSLPA
jgi:glutaconate CoA-transferase subunit A